MLLRHCVAFLLTAFVSQSWGAVFSNQFVSFELPDNWECQVNDAEWICSSKLDRATKPAVILIVSKEAGVTDNLEGFQRTLSVSKQGVDPTGAAFSSKPLAMKVVKINEQDWVDSLHDGGEISNYYTRYLATTKDKLAVAITFSAHKTKWAQYSNEFIKCVQSLRIVAPKDFLSSSNDQPRDQKEVIGPAEMISLDSSPSAPPPPPSSGLGSQWRYILGGLLILAALAILLLRKKD